VPADFRWKGWGRGSETRLARTSAGGIENLCAFAGYSLLVGSSGGYSADPALGSQREDRASSPNCFFGSGLLFLASRCVVAAAVSGAFHCMAFGEQNLKWAESSFSGDFRLFREPSPTGLVRESSTLIKIAGVIHDFGHPPVWRLPIRDLAPALDRAPRLRILALMSYLNKLYIEWSCRRFPSLGAFLAQHIHF